MAGGREAPSACRGARFTVLYSSGLGYALAASSSLPVIQYTQPY